MSGFLVRRARIVPVGADAVAPPEPVDVLVQDGRVVEVGTGLIRPAGAEEYAAAGHRHKFAAAEFTVDSNPPPAIRRLA